MAETTLRDALTTALESQEEAGTLEVTPVESTVIDAPQETTEQRADRIRDEGGRFKTKEGVTDVTPKAEPSVPAELPKPPSSWKKEYWEAYQKLDPGTAKYIQEREQQFANGVSTYKQEAERAKEIFEAIAPFQQDLQTNGVSPAAWVKQLGSAHQTLVRGSPEQKLQAFYKLATDYGVPVDALLDQNVRQRFLNSPAPAPQVDVGAIVEEQFLRRDATTEVQRFAADPANVHYEAVKERMGQLLGTGLAEDLKGAYEQAVWMNPELRQSEQLRTTEAAETQRKEQAASKVASARAKTVSVKSATPTGAMASSGKKDLRSTLEEAVDAHLGGARV